MRKRQVPQPKVVLSVALEALAAAVPLELSLEEEAILVDEINQDEAATIDDIDAVVRSEDTASAVEDVLVIGTSDAMDDTTTALATSVADMAVAGTDIPAEQILPAIAENEEAVGTMSLEDIAGIKDTLRKIWEGIKDMFKRIWARILAVFHNYEMLFRSYSGKLNLLKKQLNEARSKRYLITPGDATVSVSNTARGGKAAKSASDLLDNIMAVRDVESDTIGRGAKQNLALGRLINTVLAAVEGDVKANSQSMLAASMSAFIKSASTMTKEVNKSKIHLNLGKGDVFDFGKPLPGGKQFIISVPHRDENGTRTDYGDLQHYLGTKIECITDPSHTKESAAAVSIEVPKIDILERILDETMEVLGVAIDFLGEGAKKIEAERVKMEKQSDEIVKAAASLPEFGGAQGISNKSDVRDLLKLNTHYGLMISSISSGMLGVVRTQVGSMESFIAKSLGHYKPAKD